VAGLWRGSGAKPLVGSGEKPLFRDQGACPEADGIVRFEHPICASLVPFFIATCRTKYRPN